MTKKKKKFPKAKTIYIDTIYDDDDIYKSTILTTKLKGHYKD